MPAELLYACLHVAEPPCPSCACSSEVEGLLLDLGLEFSPEVEQTSSNTIVFSILPLRKLIGSPHQIASEICRAGYERKLQANLAIASNPDAAILLARHFQGVTLVTPGEERLKLAPISLAQIFKLSSADCYSEAQRAQSRAAKQGSNPSIEAASACPSCACYSEAQRAQSRAAKQVRTPSIKAASACPSCACYSEAQRAQSRAAKPGSNPSIKAASACPSCACYSEAQRAQSRAAKQGSNPSIKAASACPSCAFSSEALLEVLHRWGVKSCEDLAALPEKGVAERLGQPGIHLRKLARGDVQRPLRLPAVSTNYKQHTELEHPLQLLEPLLFLLGRTLGDLCGLLRSQSQAAQLLELTLHLEGKPAYVARLEFPVALTDQRTILKLLQLHLERHAPAAPIKAFCLRLEPVAPRRVQGGIFLPPTPPPDKLQLTLARIAGMVGSANVGTPTLLNTHRPDAYELLPLPNSSLTAANPLRAANAQILRLAMRLFRPPLEAQVQVAQQAPKKVVATGVKGIVIEHAGPWKTSGEWWAATAWNREEWDVALDDGALYRIYQEANSGLWFVHAMYD